MININNENISCSELKQYFSITSKTPPSSSLHPSSTHNVSIHSPADAETSKGSHLHEAQITHFISKMRTGSLFQPTISPYSRGERVRGHEINMASSRPPPYSTLYAVRTLGTMDVEYTPTRTCERCSCYRIEADEKASQAIFRIITNLFSR